MVQTRLGNAGRAGWRDGWVRKRRRRRRQGGWLHKLSVIHTRTHFISPMVSWLPRPLLFLDLRSHCTCLELSIYIGMGISRFPPPTSSRTVKHTHTLVHTQPQILSLSRFTLLHITADCKPTLLLHGRVLVQNAEMCV